MAQSFEAVRQVAGTNGEQHRERFGCVLADQPSYLVPARLLPDNFDQSAPQHTIVNRDCWFSWTGRPPGWVTECYPLPRKLRSDMDLVWVWDPGVRMARPFWSGPRFRDSISHLKPGEPVRGLSRHARAVMSFSGALVNPEDEAKRLARWEQVRAKSSRLFRARGYAPVSGLIHPFQLGSLRRYYRYLLRTGGMRLGDSGSARRYVAHNESVAAFFHHRLAAFVSELAGTPVKPSYVYVAAYQDGADLPIHTDRVQCEYSITMLIDATPEPSEKPDWPLCLVAGGEHVSIRQNLGDGLFYRGRDIPHYRNRLPDGATSTSIFFHYVDQDFAGSLD